MPLAGTWARVPYLHNGSVPTLEALLTNERPTTFYRGNTTYDTARVGFDSEQPTGPNAVVYDTRLAGNSSAGHIGSKYNGDIDWVRERDALADLLEYMKTL